jgi:DNA polymerase III subunit gamma/tau
MSYLVLARKYRSQSFEQLIGQEGIVKTLLAAIKLDRVAHAYLFTGTRGVGKTSSARLFANALNNPTNDPALSAAILNGRDTDVIEIDAASNNSVDNARELIGNAIYRPLRGHKKVYIIDEVHMLSIQAFNALLKTMEEPPAHVVFILCTTETHKVPATIQSRCQRFDFRNIPVPQIAGHLGEILKIEKLSADEDLLMSVARLGNGSMRDALSLLDRLLASGEKHLTQPMLERLLGLPDRQLLVDLIEAIFEGNAASALERTGELLGRGVSVDQFLTSLAEMMRDVMVMLACSRDTSLVELSEKARDQLEPLLAKVDVPGASHQISLIEAIASRCKTSSFPRALVDTLIVRLAMAEKFADLTMILAGGTPKLPSDPDAPQARPKRAEGDGGGEKKA